MAAISSTDLDIISTLLRLVNLLLIPILIYIVKLEKRLTKGDAYFTKIDDNCPIFNPHAGCPTVRNGNNLKVTSDR